MSDEQKIESVKCTCPNPGHIDYRNDDRTVQRYHKISFKDCGNCIEISCMSCGNVLKAMEKRAGMLLRGSSPAKDRLS